MTAATPGKTILLEFPHKCLKGIKKKSEILGTLGKRVLEFWLTDSLMMRDQKAIPRRQWGYVAVNSKPDHPPGDPQGFARSHCPRGRVFANFLCRRGRSGFLIREIFYSFKRKMQELLHLFQRNGRQL